MYLSPPFPFAGESGGGWKLTGKTGFIQEKGSTWCNGIFLETKGFFFLKKKPDHTNKKRQIGDEIF
jgi:hypothetical protein